MADKNKEYDIMTKKASPPSPRLKNSVLAFLCGGTICALGEVFELLYTKIGIDKETVKILIPVTLIVLAAVLTGLGVFDKIAKHAGAGTLVPITGFANAVVSSGLEYTTDERDIIGLSRKAP